MLHVSQLVITARSLSDGHNWRYFDGVLWGADCLHELFWTWYHQTIIDSGICHGLIKQP